ncbi:MAG: insulinase family protein [Oscillospiraceae bacterium]|jgi:predicted Zn-dependent peptidase|nr:insulinase family protein [Oscillospiraceae bacterium]
MNPPLWETRKDDLLEESFERIKHSSGLEIQVLTKPGYSSCYALFSTKYGSIDTAITRQNGEVQILPEGTAHFLEHKLFESEDLDAFARFAQTGASANAFTSFEVTAYEFSCAEHFEENLEILLDFVQSPYFTQATVEKEQGIIGQEIRMYQDEPGWEVTFRLLRCLYDTHPVRIDIAGTEESIAAITADLLHDCYRNFYDLNNMILTIAGNVTKETVLAAADKLLKPASGKPAVRRSMCDQKPPAQVRTSRKMAVAVPRFALGIKEPLARDELSAKDKLVASMALDILAGKSSALYESLLNDGLINAGFGSEYFCGHGYACSMFEGESKRPEEAAARIEAAVLQAAKEGIGEEDFLLARKKYYGRVVMEFNDIESLAREMTESYFGGGDLFESAQILRSLTLDDMNTRLAAMFRADFAALSLILPIETTEVTT